MSQKLLIQCPNCNARLALPNSSQSEFAVGCPKCQLQFRVQNPAPLPAPQSVNPPPETLERLEPVEKPSAAPQPTTPMPGNRTTPSNPAPIVQAETAKPARLVQAVPVNTPQSQSPPASPAAPDPFQQPHVGATQLPIDSKGNFRGSVTKRDLPNFDFEATNAKFELHANAPGSKPKSVDASEQKENEASTNLDPQSKQPTDPAQTDIEPTELPRQVSTQVGEREKQVVQPVDAIAKQGSGDLFLAPGSGNGSTAPLSGNTGPTTVEPAPETTAQPGTDNRMPSGVPVQDVPATGNSQVAKQNPEAEQPEGANIITGQLGPAEAEAEAIDRSATRVATDKPLPQVPEPAAKAGAKEAQAKTLHASTNARQPEEMQPSAAESEKDKLAKIAAIASKDEGNNRKGRRGKRGRRNKKKGARVKTPSQAESRTRAATENKSVAEAVPKPLLQERSENASPQAIPKSESKQVPSIEPQLESPVIEATQENRTQKQDAAPKKPSGRQVAPAATKEKVGSGTYSEHKSSKRLKKKPVKKGGAAAKPNAVSAKKEKAASRSAKVKRKEQEVRGEPEQSGEEDWTSYHYLANRSSSKGKNRKAILAGVLSLLALCFAIWAVIKSDLFKELSRPDQSDSGSEVAVEAPVNSSHPFVNLYIKILQARISSLEQLSPTAEAMISYRKKNPVAGDIEYLLEKALIEEPAPREARKVILSDLSKLESEQQKLEDDLLKAMNKAERVKWDKWLRTESTESKELAAELQLCFKSYRSDGLFSLPVPTQDDKVLWLSLEETQVVRNCLKSLATVESGETANFAGTRLFKEAGTLFANAIKRTEAGKSNSEVPQSYKEFLFAAKMARNAVVNRLQREQLVTPTLQASLQRLDAAHEAFRLAGLGKSEAEVRAAFPDTSSSVANAP